MSAQILKHLCTCEGKGWIFENGERDICMAGCLPPTKPPTDFSTPQGVRAMAREYQRQFGKAVA